MEKSSNKEMNGIGQVYFFIMMISKIFRSVFMSAKLLFIT